MSNLKYVSLWLSGLSRVKCCRFPNVSANEVTVFRVDVYWEPTKKLTKDGVLREAQEDVSCSGKPFLRTKRTAGIGEHCLSLWPGLWLRWRFFFFALAEVLDMFRLGVVAIGGTRLPSGNLSFAKITLLGWMSGSWTQKGWDRFGWRPLRRRGSFWLNGSMIGDRRTVPFWSFPSICLTT
jgi:hypothetical protein